MNKRHRTDDNSPDKWSYLSKAWNASTLAENVAELTEQVSDLQNNLQQTKRQYGNSLSNIRAEKDQYQLYYEQVLNTFEDEKRAHKEVVDTIKHKSSLLDAKNKANADKIKQLILENEKLTQLSVDLQEKFEDCVAKNNELERSNAEHRGRTKTWRVRYEKLVEKGATALATKTVAEYGVTPNEVSLYKNFAQKQAAAARAAEEVKQAALEATKLGLKSLQDI